MSIASSVAEVGFEALLATNGESLGFRNASIRAIVNRFAREPNAGIGRVDLNSADMSSIQFRASDLPGGTLPARGESFHDEFGSFHRVQKSKNLGLRIHCECVTSY